MDNKEKEVVIYKYKDQYIICYKEELLDCFSLQGLFGLYRMGDAIIYFTNSIVVDYKVPTSLGSIYNFSSVDIPKIQIITFDECVILYKLVNYYNQFANSLYNKLLNILQVLIATWE